MFLNLKKIIGLTLFCAAIVLVVIYYFANSKVQQLPELNIVLSPHYDDAVLSLGGFISQNRDKTVVATFFTQNASTTSETQWDKWSGFSNSSESFAKRSLENNNALHVLGATGVSYSFVDSQYRVGDQSVAIRKGLVESIEALIQKNKSYKLNIYGPAFFGNVITHVDHKLLHEALMEVAGFHAKDSRVSFFMYEDFPYVQVYNEKNTDILKLFIENNNHVALDLVPLNLSVSDLTFKKEALLQYVSQIRAFNTLHEDLAKENQLFTSTRCDESPCEVVYRISALKD